VTSVLSKVEVKIKVKKWLQACVLPTPSASSGQALAQKTRKDGAPFAFPGTGSQKRKIKINVKSVGQECPTHTRYLAAGESGETPA
jgi:hypothetical protein